MNRSTLRLEILIQAERLAAELGAATDAELSIAVGASSTADRALVRAEVNYLFGAGELELFDYVRGRPRYVPGHGGQS